MHQAESLARLQYRADICVYAYTGHVGNAVAQYLVRRRDTSSSGLPLTLLLAGRDVAKVRELRDQLLVAGGERNNEDDNIAEVLVNSHDESYRSTTIGRWMPSRRWPEY